MISLENGEVFDLDFLPKRFHNFGNLAAYGDAKYKLVGMRTYTADQGDTAARKFTAKGEAGNDGKLADNITRARSRIQELAYCNPWEWFATFTLDKTKYDRRDLPKFIKALGQFIRDYRKSRKTTVKYLLVPERHKDGAWHLHGFLLGLPVEHLHEFTLAERLPYKIRNRLQQGKRVYTWEPYASRFGFASIEAVESPAAAGNYILKYITKDTANTITKLNAHMFYSSKGLESKTLLHQDFLAREIEDPDLQNEYVTVKWYDDIGQALACFEGVNG